MTAVDPADGSHPPTVPPVLVLGASAGGVEALRELVPALPADLPACVLVVMHVPRAGRSALPAILQRDARLVVRHAEDGDRLVAGEVLIAPPNLHLVVTGDHVSLSSGPQENGFRPAVDVLFRSAARMLGPAVVGVVLSGSLDDGSAGLATVARRGGAVFVQHPDEALYDEMPRAAAAAAGALALPVRDLVPAVVTALVERARSAGPADARLDPADPAAPDRTLEMEADMADLDPAALHDPDRPGEPAGFGCPDCGGSLFRIHDHGLSRFRCRVGHAWSAESLLSRQAAEMESALWTALRSLEERAALHDDMAERASRSGRTTVAASFGSNAAEVRGAAELVRRLIDELGGVGPAPTA